MHNFVRRLITHSASKSELLIAVLFHIGSLFEKHLQFSIVMSKLEDFCLTSCSVLLKLIVCTEELRFPQARSNLQNCDSGNCCNEPFFPHAGRVMQLLRS